MSASENTWAGSQTRRQRRSRRWHLSLRSFYKTWFCRREASAFSKPGSQESRDLRSLGSRTESRSKTPMPITRWENRNAVSSSDYQDIIGFSFSAHCARWRSLLTDNRWNNDGRYGHSNHLLSIGPFFQFKYRGPPGVWILEGGHNLSLLLASKLHS